MKRQPPVHPFAVPLLAIAAIAVIGVLYGLFGIGKDTLIGAFSALVIFGLPVVVIFGVAGIVLGVRHLLKGRKP